MTTESHRSWRLNLLLIVIVLVALGIAWKILMGVIHLALIGLLVAIVLAIGYACYRVGERLKH